jgi:uncharacterized protein (TIGR02646 family)
MLKIPNRNLPAQAVTLLDQYQADVDAAGDYATCVAAAKSTFKSRNRATNPAFSAVRTKLTEMCSGIGRCMYCEDAPADEVEHHRPKDLYPELVFVWRNYLYACGPCNGPKNNRFAVIDQTTQQLVNVSRQKKAPVVPPAPGAPALLDPRQEDPLDFLMLDLRDTFYLTPLYAPGTVEFLRADYTLEVLRLNARDGLVEARESAFGGYRARLCEFIQQRDAGAGSLYLAGLTAGFRSSPHATVWSEMKRQHGQHPELVDLFRQAPEALEF